MNEDLILKVGDRVEFCDVQTNPSGRIEHKRVEGVIVETGLNGVRVKYEKNNTIFERVMSKNAVHKLSTTHYCTWEPSFDGVDLKFEFVGQGKAKKEDLDSIMTRVTKMKVDEPPIIKISGNLMYNYPKIAKIEEKRKLCRNKEKNGIYTTFIWDDDKEPTILKKGNTDSGSLEEAFLYAFFYKTMEDAKGWSKTKSKKFLKNLKTEQEKRLLAEIEKEKEKLKEKEKAEKEHKLRVEMLAKKELRKQKLEEEIQNKINELKKSKSRRGRKRKC